MKKEIRIQPNDGFESGLAQKSEQCDWCDKKIRQYVSCYYGGKRVGNVIICKECGDRASAEEDLAKYGNGSNY